MPAAKESRIKETEDKIESLGIIAGGGDMPARLLSACDERGIRPFIVALEGQADMQITKGREHMIVPLGAAGRMIDTLKSHNIRDLVLIGSVRRPSLTELKPDMKTAGFLAKVGLSLLGDDGVLSAIRKELEHEGFRIRGIQDFTQELLAREGVLGRYKPKKFDMADIVKGFALTQELGRLDIGQAAIVQNGIVLGVEAIEGTDSLITRCALLKRKGGGGVLVKSCKPQQDRNLDLPTIGPQTIEKCAEAGFNGIAVHAGHSLLLDLEKVKELADKHKIFVIGINPETIND